MVIRSDKKNDNFFVRNSKRLGLFLLVFVVIVLLSQSLENGLVISLAIASLITHFVIDRYRWSIGLSKNRELYNFIKGLCQGSISVLSIFTMVYFFGGHTITGFEFNGMAILAWTVSCLIGALSEEIFVRGYIYGIIKYKFGAIVSSIISSGLFAVFHFTRPDVSLVVVCTLFLAGMLYSYMREKTGAIWLPLGFHFAWNFISGIMGIWREKMVLFKTVLSQHPLVNGGAYGIEGSVFTVVLFLSLVAIVCINNVRPDDLRIQLKK